MFRRFSFYFGDSMQLFLIHFRHALHNFLKFGIYIIVVFALMGKQAAGAVFHALFVIFAVAAALLS